MGSLVSDSAKSEIAEFCHSLLVYKNVAIVEIAMNDRWTLFMQINQTINHVAHLMSNKMRLHLFKRDYQQLSGAYDAQKSLAWFLAEICIHRYVFDLFENHHWRGAQMNI